MKKVFKIFKIFIITILLLIIVLTIVAKIAETKITALALDKAGEIIEAPLKIDEASFTLLRKFPLSTIEFKGVWMGAHIDSTKDVTENHDTLVYIKKLYVSVRSKDLIKNKFTVKKVEVKGLKLNYLIDTAGISDFDFLIDTTSVEEPVDTTPSSPLFLELKEFLLDDITLKYADETSSTKATIHIPKIKIKGKINDDIYSGSIKGNLDISDCSFEDTKLYLMSKTSLNFNLRYSGDSVYVKKASLFTDGADFNVTGYAIVKDDIYTDIKVVSNKIDLGELLKYAPDDMLAEYRLKSGSGIINLDIAAKGYVSDSVQPNVVMNIAMKNGSLVTKDYPAIKNLAFNGYITNGSKNNNQTTYVNFKDFTVATANSIVSASFSVKNIDHPKYKLHTDLKVNFDEFKQFIPDTLLKDLSGSMTVNLSTSGQLPDSIDDKFINKAINNTRIKINLSNINIKPDDELSVNNLSAKMAFSAGNFKLTNFKVSVPAYHVNLKNTQFIVGYTGQPTNVSSLAINLKNYHIETDSCIFDGVATVKNIDYPEFTFKSNIKLNLDEIYTMMPDSVADALSGNITAKISSYGKINIDSIQEDEINKIVFEQSSFDFDFDKLTYHMFDDETVKLDDFSAKLSMKDDTILINKLSGNYAGINFGMDSTQIWNVYKTVIKEQKDQTLIVQTNLSLGKIDYAMIEAMSASDSTLVDSTKEQTETAEIKPEEEQQDSIAESTGILPDFAAMGVPHFLVRGKMSVEQVIYEKNIIDDISLLFRFADSLYVIDQFKLKIAGGDINTSLKFDARKWETPVVDIKNYITNLDLNKLLVDNNNFDQTEMTADNLSGILTSELHTRVFIEGDSIPMRRIRAKGEFNLENGKIYNYKPLVDASVGIGGLKELDSLEFNTLKTGIFVFKNKIFIPKTDVVSSALDLSAFAMQSLTGDDYEYHIILHLKDVLAGKSKKLMEQQAKQAKKGDGIADRSGINLVALHIGDKTKNGFDTKKLKKKFENKLNIQQGFLNLAFRPKLVNFSTDFDRTAKNKN
jgi:hypothetical protein